MAKRKHPDLFDHPGLFDEEIAPKVFASRLPGVQLPPEEEPEPTLIDEPIALAPGEEPIRFMSFGSGSSGNCSYIGTRRGGFLIDAGVDPAKVINDLLHQGITTAQIKGICLTHDHGDHVRYAYAFLRTNRHMSLYCTPKTLNGLLRRHSISRRIKDYHKPIYKEFPFHIGRFTITPFEVMHDGSDNVGFFTELGAHRLAVATDLGCISERVEHYMGMAQFIVLESNYDHKMLMEGIYPDYLKARIMASNGHLDNSDAAKFIASIYNKELRYLFLCHLSNDNNTPDKAIAAHCTALESAHPGIKIGNGTRENLSDIQIIALPRYAATPMFVLRRRPASAEQ